VYEWLYEKLYGHMHRWDAVKTERVYGKDCFYNVTCREVTHMQCVICGKIKYSTVNYGVINS